MSALHDRPTQRPSWEPEPLHLPVDDEPTGERGRRQRSDRDDQNVTGSHVIVIDLD